MTSQAPELESFANDGFAAPQSPNAGLKGDQVEEYPPTPLQDKNLLEQVGDGKREPNLLLPGAERRNSVIEGTALEPGYATIIVTSEAIPNDGVSKGVSLQNNEQRAIDPDIDMFAYDSCDRIYPNDVTTTQETEIDSGASQGVNDTSPGKVKEKGAKDDRVYPGDVDSSYKGERHSNDVTYTDETQVDTGKAEDLPIASGIVDEEKREEKKNDA